MKRQSLSSKSGFTMVEILIVIAMLLIFFSATNLTSWKPKTEIERVERIRNGVMSLIRNESLKSSIGKMPTSNGKIASTTILRISTGGINIIYKDGTNILATGSFITPYYDGDINYSITGVEWTGGTTPSSGSIDLVLQGNTMTFSGISDPTNILLDITTSYNSRTRRITIDRRTGKIMKYGE